MPNKTAKEVCSEFYGSCISIRRKDGHVMAGRVNHSNGDSVGIHDGYTVRSINYDDIGEINDFYSVIWECE